MPVTIYDVAKQAGVSKSTVSLVLNESPMVKLKTRQKVLETIQKMGYEPNQSARTLMTKRTNILGVLIIVEQLSSFTYNFDQGSDIFSYDIIAGMPQSLLGTGYGIAIERFCISAQKGEIPNMLKGGRVDGILVLGALFDKDFANLLKASGLPVVTVHRDYNLFDSVVPDIEQGVYDAASYLFQTGHKRFCYINCPRIFSTNKNRRIGFLKALDENTKQLKESWIVDAEHNTGKGGYDAIKEILESGKKPDAILAANDTIALGIIRYLYDKNIKIPKDVSIVGYENSVLSGYASPALSTIDIDKERMGKEASEIVLKRLDDPDMPRVCVTIPAKLILRDTVKERKRTES
ncbi:LacI family transcriptional regulator [Treponema sp. OttesenSCG-928-L16]|nr:LacI family transcriptional regulator [Treponema sp. OttesenSCG-928-L16]